MMLNKIGFTVIFTTSEVEKYPANELNQHGPTVRGWQSAKNCQFPQEIIMKLSNPITLHRIQVLAHQYLIPEKVEIWATNNLVNQQSEPVNEQAFRYLGYITLADNQATNFKSRELKSVSVPSQSATHLKLRLSKNHENAFNVDNQVSLIAINILGTELNESLSDSNSNEPEKVTVSSQAYTFSPYDDLAFEMYVDIEVADYIRKLDLNKQKAVQEERFEYARKLKIVIEKLREAGEKLGKYDLEKRHAIDMEDYERARRKKIQGDDFRKQIYQQLQVHLLLETNGPNAVNDEYTDAELATLTMTGTSDSNILSPPPPNGINSSLQVPIRSSSREAVTGSPAIASPLHHLTRPRSPGTGKSSPTNNNNPRGNSLRRRNKSSGSGKSSFEAYEERTVPALRHSHTNDFLRECHMENPPETKILSKLNDREKKQAALPILVFGNELVEKFYSKQFSDKEDGLNRLKDELRNYDSNPTHTANKTARAAIFLLHRALRDKVFSVYSLSAEVIRLFFTEFILGRVSQTEIARSVDRLLPELLAKSGDPTPRIHNMAIHTILSMADCEQVRELHLIPVHLTRPVSSSTHPRLAQSRIEMVEQLILNHGISTDKQSGLTCRVLAEFGSSGLHHPAEPVRKVAERVLLLVYKVNPRLVRKQLPPDDEITRRNLLYRHLYHEFDKVDLQRKKDLLEKNKSFTSFNDNIISNTVTKSKSSSNVTSSYIISSDGGEFNRYSSEIPTSKLVESKSMYSTKLLNDGEEDCLSVRFENDLEQKIVFDEAGSSTERRTTFKDDNEYYQMRRNTIGGEVEKVEDNKNHEEIDKRNSASSTTSGVSSPSPSDYSQKDGYKQCIFCSKPDSNCNGSDAFSFGSSVASRPNYFTDDQLNSHYWRWCPMLTRCVDCDQVVEISTLTIHRLLECDNSQSYRQCRRCREAIPLSDYVVHVSSMECIEALSAHTKCPLCHCNVPQGDLNWKDHLMGPKACIKNTRAPGSQGIQAVQGNTLKRDRKV